MIKCQVAKVLSPHRVAITAGEEQGVVVGMKFSLVRENTSVEDPVTGNHLGQWEQEVLKLEVEEVQEKFSVAKPLVDRSKAAEKIVVYASDKLIEIVDPELQEAVQETQEKVDGLLGELAEVFRSLFGGNRASRIRVSKVSVRTTTTTRKKGE